MLINFENNQEIKEVWHKKEYDVFINKIEKYDKTAFDKMKEEINNRLENSEVNVTSWMPGKNWSGTPFQPIYDALGDYDCSAMCFGLIVQECIIEHPQKWSFTKMDDVKGMVYFRINK